MVSSLLPGGRYRLCYNSTMRDDRSILAYSTDKPVPRKKGTAREAPATPHPRRRTVSVRLDRKGRGGKSVTLIEGLRMPVKNENEFLKQLKKELGTGGTLKADVFEIQGDHRDAIIELLQDMGHKPKRVGG